MRAFDRDLIRGGHYGQRSCEPHPKAEHMAAPTNAANVKKALANPEPSTHGPKGDTPSVSIGVCRFPIFCRLHQLFEGASTLKQRALERGLERLFDSGIVE